MNHLEIHEKALQIARQYQTTEVKLIEILQVVNREKVYKTLGYTSLFSYCVEALKLPPERVYHLNVVAKKCDEVPELKVAIDQGLLNISKARRIAPVIDRESSGEWIQKAATLPQRQLEKEIARLNPREALPEKTKILNSKDVFLSCTISIEAQEKLERLKDVLSQKFKKPMGLREVIEYLADVGVEKLDPLAKAQRNVDKPKPEESLSSRTKMRTPLPAAIKHQVALRDNLQCTEIVNGVRCSSRRWLQMHHRKPVSMGSNNTAENLTILCSGHHRMIHGHRNRGEDLRHG